MSKNHIESVAKQGEQVMALLRRLFVRLKLQINDAKSAVASTSGNKFLGYALQVAMDRQGKCKVAEKPLEHFKARIRQLTRRSGGCKPDCGSVYAKGMA